MALPSIILPEYPIKLLTSNKDIIIRPFTVREEKILLMALEGGIREISQAIKQIVTNCIKGDVNIDNLDFFELLYIFMHTKRVSSGEEIKCKITEVEEVTENNKKKKIEHTYTGVCNLNKDIVVNNLDKLKEFEKPIQITGNDIFVEIKPLKFKDYIKLINMFDIDKEEDLNKDNSNKIKFLYTSMLLTIKNIYNNEESFNPDEYTIEELEQFYESFPQKNKIELQKKYENLPRIALKFHYKDKDDNEKVKELDHVNFNFFV